MRRVIIAGTWGVTLLWLTLFSIAMGYLESAVVIYLRIVYYPDGFNFPLVPLEPWVALTEFGREAATLIMLITIGYFAGSNFTKRFAWFLYCFALWDIFYYVFLKIILDWPVSLLTWDILFLLPVPWIGPVLSPVLTSLTMILLALVLIYYNTGKSIATPGTAEWILLVLGSLLILTSWTYEYIHFIYSSLSPGIGLWSPGSSEKLFREGFNYIPEHYNWWLFGGGEVLYLTAIAVFVKRKGVLRTT